MKRLALSALGAVSLLGVATAPALAMPVPSASTFGVVGTPAENVRLVCDQFGRCWRTGPRRVVRRYHEEPAYYGPSYSYSYGPGYGYGPAYGYGPSYGYYGLGYGFGPSIGLGFGFGRGGW